MEPLKDKIIALLIQLPPGYKLKEGLEDFSSHDFFFEGDFRYAVEVRNSTWSNDLATTFLKITILQCLESNGQITNPSNCNI